MGSVGVATLTNVSATTGSITLSAANSGRNSVYIYNDSTTTLNVKFGATASATSFTDQIAAGGFWSLPDTPVYRGLITGIWAAGTGAARITEL